MGEKLDYAIRNNTVCDCDKAIIMSNRRRGIVNLYEVYEVGADYCTFVFAETRNRARVMMIGYFWDEEYINLRARLLAKDVGGKEEVVEHEEQENYKRVIDLGFKYLKEEETEEWMDKWG